MADGDELGRTLALARQALRGPAAMKERLRVQLVAQPAGSGADGVLGARTVASSAGHVWLRAGRGLLAQRFALGTVALLVGAGFGAGFWLGRQPAHAGSTDAAAASRRPSPPAAAEASSTAEVAAARAGVFDAARPTAPAANTADDSSATASSAKASSATAPVEASRVGASRVRASSPRRARAAIEPSDDALMREVALLERIDRAIRSGEANLALALLTELDQAVPAPALRDERDAARVLARCVATGDESSSARQQARIEAERYLAQNATSVYADRIRSACPLDGIDVHRQGTIEEPGRVGH